MRESSIVKDTLSKTTVHDQWEGHFRNAANEKFYDRAFDWILETVRPLPDSTILDVGCGVGAHSIRLARRGFRVIGCDFADAVLEVGRSRARQSGLEDRVTFLQKDILELSFPSESFEYVLCWGVLMHIPDVERALTQLARVLKPGGVLILSEGNQDSLQSFFIEGLKKLLKKGDATALATAAGMEYWTDTPAGRLLIRQADVQWLRTWFERRGFVVVAHRSGQFTEVYTRFKSETIKRFIHGFNSFWFERVRSPRWSFANILIVRKP
jgi:2-polyprenyl-3-methyl-5-hydroxy-6-metoxy-1,4-benzoquinol methylase